MKEFALLFRNESNVGSEITPQQMELMSSKWQHWVGGIAAQGKLVSPGSRLGFNGRVVQPGDNVVQRPYAEINQILSGFHVIKTSTLDEATEIANDCPILSIGGSVEVREIIPMNN